MWLDLSDLIDELASSTSAQGCWEALGRHANSLGINDLAIWSRFNHRPNWACSPDVLSGDGAIIDQVRQIILSRDLQPLAPKIAPASNDGASLILIPLASPNNSHLSLAIFLLDQQQSKEGLNKLQESIYLSTLYANMYASATDQQSIKEKSNIKLTKRQSEILNLMATGMQNAQIAAELGISLATVSFHLKEMKKRMGVRSAREVFPKALMMGLIEVK